MKALTFVFALFVLFLALKPGIECSLPTNAITPGCSSYCSMMPENDSEHPQRQDDPCTTNACNPFQVCSSCVLLCLDPTFTQFTTPVVFSASGFIYQPVFTTPTATDIWQPPKTV